MTDKCLVCKKIRRGKWALLFGPPKIVANKSVTEKDHLCPQCWYRIKHLSRHLKSLMFQGLV